MSIIFFEFPFKAAQQHAWHSFWEYAGRKASSALLSWRWMMDIEQSTILPHSYHCLGPVFQGRTCDTKETQCQTRLTLHTITWRHSWEVAARPGTGFQPPWFSHGNRTCSQPHHAYKAKLLRCKHVSCMLSPLPLPTSRSQEALGPGITEENHLQKSWVIAPVWNTLL